MWFLGKSIHLNEKYNDGIYIQNIFCTNDIVLYGAKLTLDNIYLHNSELNVNQQLFKFTLFCITLL